jgi:hypothetical protein
VLQDCGQAVCCSSVDNTQAWQPVWAV